MAFSFDISARKNNKPPWMNMEYIINIPKDAGKQIKSSLSLLLAGLGLTLDANNQIKFRVVGELGGRRPPRIRQFR